ncbi:hypothetical protein M422DRAFT_259047 [Sphaerobolus stellatus SS14]|uniref:Unplaced genomic scaffold SPHSTscaffold_86, whole genome shotgun sequence n=1 Tax=Sphaerobolus stellatus (strain SS14) TaxID=990650 RepID=A0A0C9UU69_SPHS4|nr:hypothetical protein M422DRAFT_259047 [Sphaerobolus stellatus SS14]
MSSLVYTPLEEIEKVHGIVREGFAHGTGKLADVESRKNQLLQLGYAFKDNFSRWADALKQDMGRPKLESYESDLPP